MKVKSVIHEYGLNGRHRIVVMDEAGDLHPGEWAAYTALSQNGGYLAATEFHVGDLPTGVFCIRAVAHKTITA